MRICPSCDKPLPPTKRSNAIYCNRKCKAAAAEQRRPERDHAARYLRERDRRIAYATEPVRMREAASRRRARMRGVERFEFSRKDWLNLVDRHRGCCAYCGERKPLTIEHVVPLSRGGRHSVGNIVPACFRCNSSKNARFITEWRNGISVRRAKCDSLAVMAS